MKKPSGTFYWFVTYSFLTEIPGQCLVKILFVLNPKVLLSTSIYRNLINFIINFVLTEFTWDHTWIILALGLFCLDLNLLGHTIKTLSQYSPV